MDTVSAQILSTKPISLSKAASVLSSFISAGADAAIPQSTATYLNRTLDAFDELVRFHRGGGGEGGAKAKSKKRHRSPTSSGVETKSETGSQTKKKKKSKKRRLEDSSGLINDR